MSQKLYLECYAGISGDMMVAALLDLGADTSVLENTLNSLHLDGYSVTVSRVKKSGLDVCDFAVTLDEEYENHDHDMEYLHGHGYGHTHDHEHHHGHDHRGVEEILNIIESSAMTEGAKNLTIRIFDILAEAEAKAHGVPEAQVHFHEVGAVDSIVDIVSVAVCLDNLGIEEVIIPVLFEGCGHIRCQHGVIPVPVPATLNIVQAHGLRLHQTETEGEFVTPTGAAIAAAICTSNTLPEQYKVSRIGLGAGKRNYERPSILRAMLIEEVVVEETASADKIYKLECNVDDCSGEVLGYVMTKLMDQGALDVHYTPVFMKKNRPAYVVTVLCNIADRRKMERILFEETTTIGIRRQRMERTVLRRKREIVSTTLGKVKVKVIDLPKGRRITPEYESVAEIARKKDIPYVQALAIIEDAISGYLRRGK